jgi:exodeoxyribonuclease V beta subunit
VQQHLGPLSLLRWYAQLRADPESRTAIMAESEQMRLEHDEHALRLTTVHRSKGLEYPVVFCPYLWWTRPDRDGEVRFHDPDDADRAKLDLGGLAFEAHKRLAQREERAENLRLLYVALTRAKHRCYVVWGNFKDSDASPLGYLLHARASQAEPDGKVDVLGKMPDPEMLTDLEALCSASEGSIGVREILLEAPPPYSAGQAAGLELAPRTATREHVHAPRMTSFSQLTADAVEALAAGAGRAAGEAPDHDAETPDAVLRDPGPGPLLPKVALHAFPSGSRPGSLIHAVYEHIDFQRGDPAELDTQAQRFLEQYGIDAAQHKAGLVAGISASLLTPLDAATPPLTLAVLPRQARLNELEFTLSTTRGRLSSERLAAAFRLHGAPACDPSYAERLAALGEVPPAGFLKGFVDLVFRHGERFYVADYKSNWLGEHARDYGQERMVHAMREHHYFLQYHLYVLALHRHLALRLPGYDYERHFGGVFYLFVRGMAPAHPHGSGVFFDRPKLALIEALADALGAAGGAA